VAKLHNHIKSIAFYLPQYHPIDENNNWWGNGFTEWTNVAKSVPLYPRHYQPRIPADLGFYDLRLSETREAQADLARSYGIHGFCYYHYWFNGRRLLERPINDILELNKPDFPFCLCWANESWSRRWIGEHQQVLIEQTYSADDDLAHASYLSKVFSDSRYITIDQRPLFLVYRPSDLPKPSETLNRFERQCSLHGIKRPYFVAVDAHHVGYDYRVDGFDTVLAFTPQLGVSAPDAFNDKRSIGKFIRNLRHGVLSSKLKLFDELEERNKMQALKRSFPVIPSCFVSWDNTARRGRDGIVYANPSPSIFKSFFRKAVAEACQHPHGHSLVFINAWNEWAEGNHLEPDLRYGHSYLQAVREVLFDHL
jgi:hypothetical protein